MSIRGLMRAIPAGVVYDVDGDAYEGASCRLSLTGDDNDEERVRSGDAWYEIVKE